MKKTIRLALLGGLLAGALHAQASPPGAPGPSEPAKFDIRVNRKSDWGCSPADAQQVCDAAARELRPFFPGRSLPTILVEPKGGPIVLYRRGTDGEIRVRLNVQGTYWAQMTYQFSHELCHILCDYKENPNPTKWFEESVCELASLFVLRRSAETWKTRPPYPNWKSYSSALRKYADERMEKARLPEGQTLAGWYRENAEALSKNATDRTRNTTVATELLPVFEGAPEHWEAVSFINKEQFDATTTFPRFLEAWHANCPEKHRPFVREIALKFGIGIPSNR